MKTARIAAFVLSVGLGLAVQSQCGTVISAFPYQEGFESAEQWTHGGIGDDWLGERPLIR